MKKIKTTDIILQKLINMRKLIRKIKELID